eukprot:5129764-Prymnesium_polylepis.1
MHAPRDARATAWDGCVAVGETDMRDSHSGFLRMECVARHEFRCDVDAVERMLCVLGRQKRKLTVVALPGDWGWARSPPSER